MTRNLTLALDEELLDQARVFAAKRRTTVTELVRSHLRMLVQRDDRYEAACRQLRSYMEIPPLAVGRRRWTRDELHER